MRSIPPYGGITDEPGFLKKHMHGLRQTGLFATLGGLIYAVVSVAVGINIVNNSFVYEHFNSRAKIEIKLGREERVLVKAIETMDRYGISVVKPIEKAIQYPWKAMGYVTPDRYKEVRSKALRLAGIDEENPLLDNWKRFALYRQLGYAVLTVEDLTQGIYIPFKVWKDFVEKTSGYKNPEWDKWHEPETSSGGKFRGHLLGKVFYKADSKAQGGNEDGLVNPKEWKRALTAMGYTTLDEIVANIIKKVKSIPQLTLDSELRRIVKDIKFNPYFLADNDTRIPIATLEAYVSSK